jgi:hypothetical protein
MLSKVPEIYSPREPVARLGKCICFGLTVLSVGMECGLLECIPEDGAAKYFQQDMMSLSLTVPVTCRNSRNA